MDDKANELALEAIIENKIGQLTIYSGLDIARPETINNFNTFGMMLLAAYNKGKVAAGLQLVELPTKGVSIFEIKTPTHRADEYTGNTQVVGVLDHVEALNQHKELLWRLDRILHNADECRTDHGIINAAIAAMKKVT